MVTTMAIGEEDGQGPVVTSLAHGEEEDASGTQIEDQPLILPDPQALVAEPPASRQIPSVADIITRIRIKEGQEWPDVFLVTGGKSDPSILGIYAAAERLGAAMEAIWTDIASITFDPLTTTLCRDAHEITDITAAFLRGWLA